MGNSQHPCCGNVSDGKSQCRLPSLSWPLPCGPQQMPLNPAWGTASQEQNEECAPVSDIQPPSGPLAVTDHEATLGWYLPQGTGTAQ